MRERSLWKRPLLEQLRRWQGAIPVSGGDLDLLCDVELSLSEDAHASGAPGAGARTSPLVDRAASQLLRSYTLYCIYKI
jgi:hypothetical protein